MKVNEKPHNFFTVCSEQLSAVFFWGGAMNLTSRFKTRPKQTLYTYFKSLKTCGRGKTVEHYTYSDLTLSTNLLNEGFICGGRVKMEPCMMNITLYRIQFFCRLRCFDQCAECAQNSADIQRTKGPLTVTLLGYLE